MNWWKIKCLSCDSKNDLLTDIHKRIICRECLNKNEFNEVESEIFSDDVSIHESGMVEMEPTGEIIDDD